MTDSRPIIIYLAEKYGKDDSLYPKIPKDRALVNQRLFFDLSMYQNFGAYFFGQVYFNKPADESKIQPIKDSLKFLDGFLEGQEWSCGDNMTIADIALVATISTFDVSAEMDLSGYPNIIRWYEKCKKSIPGYDANQEGAEDYRKFYAKVKKFWGFFAQPHIQKAINLNFP